VESDEDYFSDGAVYQNDPGKDSIAANKTKEDGLSSSDAHGNCDITTEDKICDDAGRDDLCDDGDNALHHRNDRMDVNTDTVTVDDDDSDDGYMVTCSHEVQELSQSNASDYDTNKSKDSETVSSVSCSGHNIKTRETAMDKAADINDVCKDVDSALQSNAKKMDVNIPSAVIGNEEIDKNNMVNSTHNEQQSSESDQDDKRPRTKIHSKTKVQERDQDTTSVPKGQVQSYDNRAQVPNNSRSSDVLAAIAATQKEAELMLKQNTNHADGNDVYEDDNPSRKRVKKSKSKRVKKEKDKRTKKKKTKKRESTS